MHQSSSSKSNKTAIDSQISSIQSAFESDLDSLMDDIRSTDSMTRQRYGGSKNKSFSSHSATARARQQQQQQQLNRQGASTEWLGLA